MSTYMPKAGDITRNWYVLDAAGKPLGKVAVEAATLLRGKHKPVFTPNTDTGDFVIIVNADKVRVTGNKVEDKKYYSHSGYIGHIKETTYKERMENCPEEIIRDAVWGMLPKNRLGRQMIKKLKVYAGDKHDHAAQKPEVIDISK